MILTIALVVYNEEKCLPLIEANLRLLRAETARARVLIVDNASTDGTLVQLRRLQNEYSFDLITRTENNMGGARADATSAATTPWLVFLDADCAISSEWLFNAFAIVADLPPRAAAVGGPWMPAGPNVELFRALFKTFYGNFNLPQITEGGRARLVRHIPTACVIYRREALVSVGNFDPERARVGEDLDMSYRLLSSGWGLLHLPELRFDHHLPESLGGWSKKIFTYGEARIRMALLHNDVLAPNYLLPILFFVFMVANLLLASSLRGIPLVAYFLTALSISFFSEPSEKALEVFVYMVATHFAYAGGMAYGACALSCEKVLKRKRLVPIPHTPPSWEEI